MFGGSTLVFNFFSLIIIQFPCVLEARLCTLLFCSLVNFKKKTHTQMCEKVKHLVGMQEIPIMKLNISVRSLLK